jgi:FkbM family methyltransferase
MAFKQIITKIITHPVIGNSIAWVYQDRIPSYGFRINTHSLAIAPSIKAALFWRMYESAEIRFVNKYLKPDLPVVELGSSLGIISCHILGKLEPNSLLISLEANPHLIELNQLNLKTNFPNRQVTVINQAIDYSGTSSVQLEIGAINTVSKVVANIQPDSQSQFQTIETTTLSKIIAAHQISKYVLFSDIEGAEAGFIFRDSQALSHCQQIILELHDTELDGESISIAKMCSSLVGLGFDLRDSYGRVHVFEKK